MSVRWVSLQGGKVDEIPRLRALFFNIAPALSGVLLASGADKSTRGACQLTVRDMWKDI